jgi:enamine deaminase RidA (YjgF/YER057c/UK114 family)
MTEYLAAENGSSGAVVHDGTVYIGAMVARDPLPTAAGQMQQILQQIDECLKACGTSKWKMLYANVYCSDTRHADAINPVWDAWVPWHDPPATTMMVAKMPTSRHYVSIQLTAAV